MSRRSYAVPRSLTGQKLQALREAITGDGWKSIKDVSVATTNWLTRWGYIDNEGKATQRGEDAVHALDTGSWDGVYKSER